MRLIGTGVELDLSDEPVEYGRPTPEQRHEAQLAESGEMVDVRATIVYETDDGSGRGTSTTARIDLRSDPTSALIALARDLRYEEDYTLGDFRDEGLTRFAYHAAPHRIELTPALRERLESAGWNLL